MRRERNSCATKHGLGFTPEEAEYYVEEVRELDTKRLKIQYHEGIYAGGDTLHLQPAKIQPEPLLKPQHPAEALDERSREVVEEAEIHEGEAAE